MHDVIIIGVGGHIRSYLIEYELVWIYGYGYWYFYLRLRLLLRHLDFKYACIFVYSMIIL